MAAGLWTLAVVPSALKCPRIYTGAFVATVRPVTPLTLGTRLAWLATTPLVRITPVCVVVALDDTST